MLDIALRRRAGSRSAVAAALIEILEHATAAIALLDQALDQHPLRAAFLQRVRLDAVRRQAAVDGHSIDPWHLGFCSARRTVCGRGLRVAAPGRRSAPR